jgi:hypothetical protein
MELCTANVLGWIGFSIYDDIIDGEKKHELIPLANLCIRKTFDFSHSYETLLDKIDYANDWEQTNCKISIINNTFEIPKQLPDYGDFETIANKSIGHALGPIILSPIKKDIVRKFFVYYLIARQLNDDAHDWLEDLQQGFLNPVSVKIIRRFQADHPHEKFINLDATQTKLQSLFWYEIIDSVATEIRQYLSQARKIIKDADILENFNIVDMLLAPLERSAEQALLERDRTIRFIEKYR